MSEAPPVTIVFLGATPSSRSALERLRPAGLLGEGRELLVVGDAELTLPDSLGTVRFVKRTGRRAHDINTALHEARGVHALLLDETLSCEEKYVDALLHEARQSVRIVAVAPKIMRSAGLLAAVGAGMGPGYRWYDRGGGEIDRGQYDENRELYAVTLLGCLVRVSWFRSGPGLDPLYATSYADIELSISALLSGYRLRYAPGARASRPAGGPGDDRNPTPPNPLAEWDRLFLLARRYPDILPRALLDVASHLEVGGDAREKLSVLLAAWGPLAHQPERRAQFLREIEQDPSRLGSLSRILEAAD
ncbi:MAG: hypothetical protein AB1486_03845 [Planctomycetota bacterium]